MPTGPPDSPFSPQERSDVGGSAGAAGEGGATQDWVMSHALETHAERIIREAMESGDFDDLPGTGKPIPGAGRVDDELWWVRSWFERNRHPDDAQEPSSRE